MSIPLKLNFGPTGPVYRLILALSCIAAGLLMHTGVNAVLAITDSQVASILFSIAWLAAGIGLLWQLNNRAFQLMPLLVWVVYTAFLAIRVAPSSAFVVIAFYLTFIALHAGFLIFFHEFADRWSVFLDYQSVMGLGSMAIGLGLLFRPRYAPLARFENTLAIAMGLGFLLLVCSLPMLLKPNLSVGVLALVFSPFLLLTMNNLFWLLSAGVSGVSAVVYVGIFITVARGMYLEHFLIDDRLKYKAVNHE